MTKITISICTSITIAERRRGRSLAKRFFNQSIMRNKSHNKFGLFAPNFVRTNKNTTVTYVKQIIREQY